MVCLISGMLSGIAPLTGCDDPADDGPSAVVGTPPSSPGETVESKPMTPEQMAQRYDALRETFEVDPAALAKGKDFDAAATDLKKISNEAKDPAMRANAALMLGALYEARGDKDNAVDFYRHAEKLVSDDAGPKMALALALASQEKFEEAAEVQAKATELDPDNLENWLALGEMQIKAGDAEAAKKTYIAYERRRKGLIDGLTLKTADEYRVPKDDRIGCARALASAADQGTGNALVYALKSDPEAEVRAAVAEVMGIQRLTMYKPVLEDLLAKETNEDIKKAVAWALTEIERDPVEAHAAGPAPEVEAPKEGTEDASEEATPEPTEAEKPAEP